MPERAWEWSKRIVFNPDSKTSLDWAQELWNWDIAQYESASAIAARYQRLGKSYDDDDILYYATRTQLMDVVDAAGAVERSHTRFHQSMDLAQKAYEKWSAEFGQELPDRLSLVDGSAEDACYSMDEIIIWTRVLLDRLRRESKKKGFPNQGLIMAMADGARRRAAIDAKSRLVSSVAGEARYLAGLSLHMQPLRPGSRNIQIRNGRVSLPFPDPVRSTIDHQSQLTYTTNRDASAFADGIMAAVARFMDGLIAAFEANVPEHLKR